MARADLHNSNALMSAYQQSRTMRPKVVSGTLPPGIRHFLSERHSVPAAQHVLHDGSVNPAGTGPFRRPRRGPTRRTPGSRPHSPQVN
jgi:hypothetical protein